MTHIGLLCPTASGHLNPMTTLGHELNQRGHRVTLVGTLDAQLKVLRVECSPGTVNTLPISLRAFGRWLSPYSFMFLRAVSKGWESESELPSTRHHWCNSKLVGHIRFAFCMENVKAISF